jgi:choline dehydrogenase-like flavoprotein
VTDAIAHSIITDPKTGKATGVRIIDQNTKETTYEARVIFLCASTIGSGAGAAQFAQRPIRAVWPTVRIRSGAI